MIYSTTVRFLSRCASNPLPSKSITKGMKHDRCLNDTLTWYIDVLYLFSDQYAHFDANVASTWCVATFSSRTKKLSVESVSNFTTVEHFKGTIMPHLFRLLPYSNDHEKSQSVRYDIVVEQRFVTDREIWKEHPSTYKYHQFKYKMIHVVGKNHFYTRKSIKTLTIAANNATAATFSGTVSRFPTSRWIRNQP